MKLANIRYYERYYKRVQVLFSEAYSDCDTNYIKDGCIGAAMGVDEYPKISVTYKGAFDFGEVYSLIHDFLADQGYQAADFSGAGPSDLYEIEYIEVGDSPRDYLIKWKTKKSGQQDFFLSRIEITFRGTAVTKGGAEMMIEGKKEKLDKGDLTIEIKSSFETDVKKIMDDHWLVKHFQGKFKEMISGMKKKEVETFEGELRDLHTFIKRYFKMKGDKMVAELSPVNKA